jgi:hypothetical protein
MATKLDIFGALGAIINSIPENRECQSVKWFGKCTKGPISIC